MDLLEGPDDFLDGGEEPADSHPELAELVAGLRAEEVSVVIATIGRVHRAGVARMQEQVARALERLGPALGDRGLDAALDLLDEVGDGRCVRPMEAFLYAHGASLDAKRAWRARHIVQRIRRLGRK